MATRQEIIEVIDALLEGKITPEEASRWAGKEVTKTPHCEDPSSALFTLIGITDPIVQKSEPWQKELPRDREVLARGVPCPRKELGKTVEAYWLAFAPWKKVVLSQIRKTEKGERILELIEEDWNGKQKLYHQMPLPITEEPGLPLASGEMQEKEDAYRKGALTREEALQWTIHQLQRKGAVDEWGVLLGFYWKLRGTDEPFSPNYISTDTETRPTAHIGTKLFEICRRETERIKSQEKKEGNP